MQTYNWNAEDYEKHSQIQQKWARELIEKLSLNGSEDVLDLGCGDGKVTVEISNVVCNGSVIGIDNSSSMITLATKQYPVEQYPNLSFQVIDARDLLFENCFDVVFSNAVLHWIKNHKPVIEGLFRSLRPGGKILLQMGAKGGISLYISVLDEILLLPEWQSYFKDFEFPYGFLGVEEYEVMLLSSCFQINRIELIPKDVTHAGKEMFKGWIRTTWMPYIERVPEEKREQFIELISTKYIAKVPIDREGYVHVAMVMLEVEAEKKA
ncbi:MAG: methyltransferase domain-containing protein [Rhizonema sp. PD38]|nr:methyltransferase domain-containing protein [Rhizonema sp. PD38]